MTDKEQIIIDGVNVSGCVYRDSENRCCCDSSKKNEGEERLTGRGGCAYNPNCYFKQLARKTQECEELKKKLMQKDEINTFLNAPIEGWSNNPCDICESKNNYERLNQEYEELTKERDYLKQIVEGCPDVACENGGFCAIDIENKRLRKEYEVLEKQLAETKTFDLSSEKIIEKLNTDQIMVSIFQDYSRYRKALEEIEKIIKEYDCVNCSEQHCEDCNKGEIFYIINKAKEEE